MKTIYFISGLGGDERIFQFLNIPRGKKKHIKWFAPLYAERLEDYAKRLSTQIHDSDSILIGVSFGGIVAVELSKILSFEKVIIISSIKTIYELPYYYKIAGKLGLNRLIPAKIFKKPIFLLNYLFGIKTQKEKELLKSMIEIIDDKFLKWALNEILHWRNQQNLQNIIHIHGTSDRILPFQNVKGSIAMENGGHLMIVDKSDKISKLLNKIIFDDPLAPLQPLRKNI